MAEGPNCSEKAAFVEAAAQVWTRRPTRRPESNLLSLFLGALNVICSRRSHESGSSQRIPVGVALSHPRGSGPIYNQHLHCVTQQEEVLSNVGQPVGSAGSASGQVARTKTRQLLPPPRLHISAVQLRSLRYEVSNPASTRPINQSKM